MTTAVATRSAVVVNPVKVADLDGRRRDICAALAEAGWPDPLWLETTPEDPGCGQTRQLSGRLGGRWSSACMYPACVHRVVG